MACGFNFAKQYGQLGQGFIHVHHIRPVAELSFAVTIDPKIDLVVLCANCHAMVHRDKENTLSIDEVKRTIRLV